ncbi:hypothetical protein BD410DRAFT_784066 [Rickenella mellea]|uniref:Uncharacterized protein n=1 Tax=Rickenella mellea TaxID=50990 RepID=A0A4Y7QED6_9AGAM|nr:hypothetical protein BD410DRAFT_784066 [Rickenella mellea]
MNNSSVSSLFACVTNAYLATQVLCRFKLVLLTPLNSAFGVQMDLCLSSGFAHPTRLTNNEALMIYLAVLTLFWSFVLSSHVNSGVTVQIL